MNTKYVVLDTNCLLQSLSQRSSFYCVWEAFIAGKYILCVTTEILEEYEEIIASHMSPSVAKLAIEIILRANNVKRVDAHYRFGLITADEDDNKFVDCAIVSNANYIVSIQFISLFQRSRLASNRFSFVAKRGFEPQSHPIVLLALFRLTSYFFHQPSYIV